MLEVKLDFQNAAQNTIHKQSFDQNSQGSKHSFHLNYHLPMALGDHSKM